MSPTRKDGKSAVQEFLGADVKSYLWHFRPLGCPVYVLHNLLQAGQQISKWHNRVRGGLYLGHPLAHAQSVALVLNLDTGLVSPQFHVKFDEFFKTVNKQDDNYPNRWKVLTHFEKGGHATDDSSRQLHCDYTVERSVELVLAVLHFRDEPSVRWKLEPLREAKAFQFLGCKFSLFSLYIILRSYEEFLYRGVKSFLVRSV